MRPFPINLYGFFRRNKYFFFGCLAGFVISSIFMPVLQDCPHPLNPSANKATGGDWPDESRLQPYFKYSPQSVQLLQHLQRWHSLVQGPAYEPVILNASAMDDAGDYSKQENLNSFDKDAILVRDKKLKFYRPRFHHTELKIKNDLLLCVLVTEQFLLQSLSIQPKFSNQTTLSRVKTLIGNYINFTSEVLFKDYDLDIYYFYPELDPKTETVFSNNLMVTFNKGHSLESIRSEDGQPKHVAMIRYLLDQRRMNEYSFAFLFSDHTLLSVDNLFEHMQTMTVSDYVLSTWNEQSQPSPFNDFLWQNLLRNDEPLKYGLLMSSSLLLQCQLNLTCLRDCITQPVPVIQDSEMDSNVFQWHNAYHFKSDHDLTSLSPENIAEFESYKESISKAIVLYPVNYRSQVFSMIQLQMAQRRIQMITSQLTQLENKIESLRSNEANSSQKTPKSWPPGVFDYQKPRTRYEVIRWTYWNASHVFMPNDIQVSRPLNPSEKAEVEALEGICQEWLRAKHEDINGKQLQLERAYRRFDAVRGLEYLVDMRQINSATGADLIRLQVVKPLNPVELMTDVPYVTENMRLTLVLPVRGEQEVPLAIKFLNNYANVCLKPNHQTVLIIALIYTRHLNVTDSIESMLEFEKKEFDRLKKVSLYIQSKFSVNSLKIIFMDLNPPDPSGLDLSTSQLSRFPSELVYLDIIARSLTASSSEPFLMLHCRTNMLFSTDFLNRVRLNTIAGRQVFMPIPFVEYRLRTTVSNSLFQQSLRQSPWSAKEGFASILELANKAKSLYFDVRKENGFFDETNFEFVSFYLSDYLKARQMSEKWMPIVRNHHSIVKYQHLYYNAKMDLKHLFGGFNVDQQNAPIHMRAVEPELRLFHSSILDSCEHFESNIYSFESCRQRQLHGLGPKQKLASIVMEYLELKRGSRL